MVEIQKKSILMGHHPHQWNDRNRGEVRGGGGGCADPPAEDFGLG